MATAIKLYRCAESSDSLLPHAAADAIGRPGNGTSQGSFVIVARTKVEAAEIAQRTLGHYTPRALGLAMGNDLDALIEAGLVPADGTTGHVLAWASISTRNTNIVRWAPLAGRDEFTVVATWRYDDEQRINVPVPASSDPDTGLNLDLLAYDIADVIDRGEYGLDVSADDVRAALPAFLAALRGE